MMKSSQIVIKAKRDKKMKKYIIITLLLLSSLATSAATTLKSAYFMDRMPTTNQLNPALMSEYGYFSFPIIGSFNLGINSNITLDKFIFPLEDGSLGTFAHPDVDKDEFLDGIGNKNVISQYLDLPIISFGFYGWGGFNTFDLSLHEQTTFNLSKSFFELLVGSNNSSATSIYNMSDTSLDLNSWAELSVGHAREVYDNLTVGVKLKYIVGLANASLEIDQLSIKTSKDILEMKFRAVGSAAITGFPIVGSMSDLEFGDMDLSNGLSTGFGIDLGAAYEWDKFNFSVALTDLGFISWKGASDIVFSAETSFSGFEDIDINSDDYDDKINDQIDDLTADFETLGDSEFTAKDKYKTSLSTTFTAAVEYDIFDNNKLTAGALYTSTFSPVCINEFMLALTMTPIKWFSFALTGTTSTYGTYWGAVVNICPSWINLFIGTDCMIQGLTPQYIPYNSSNFNLNFGLNIPLGKAKK